jgi:SAM-dependent methyltransferase
MPPTSETDNIQISNKPLPNDMSPSEEQTLAILGTQRQMWDEKQITEYYAGFAAVYDHQIESDQGASYPSPFKIGAWVVDWLVRQQQQKPLASASAVSATRQIQVLDLGCGTGQSGVKFKEHSRLDSSFNYHLTGMDTSPEVTDGE